LKFVAVSQRVDDYPERNERRDATDQKLCAFLQNSGYLPILVPNRLSINSIEEERKKAVFHWLEGTKTQAIILSGGNSIGDCEERDETESWLLDYAEEQQLPVLGICRGMQMLGTRSGGELHEISNHVRCKHEVTGRISDVVNSYHNLCFTSCPKDYEVLAVSKDGCIEAMRHKVLPWEGWMWHPERYECFRKEVIERTKKALNT